MIPNITWGADFGGLVNYLVDHRDHEVLDLRGVSSVECAADEMTLVAADALRAKKVVMHVSVSAAIEDGTLSRPNWLQVADRIDREFGLVSRQRVIVRHRDKQYDHVHIFWCTVGQDGRVPPKQMFSVQDSTRRFALSPEQIAHLKPEQMVRRSYNHVALFRLMDLCRGFERELGLRQVRGHREARAARQEGQKRRPKREQMHRQERVGSRSLLDLADALRLALDAPDWSAAEHALAALGVTMQPAVRSTKAEPSQIRGLTLVDHADPGNIIRASDLDLPGRKYGLRQIEKRHPPDAITFEQWWPHRTPAFRLTDEAPKPRQIVHDYESLRKLFEAQRETHRVQRLLDKANRARLRARHIRERQRLQNLLMRERKATALTLSIEKRRQFYSLFSRTRRMEALGELAATHVRERAAVRVRRFPSWREFLEATTAPSTSPRSNPITVEKQSSLVPHNTVEKPSVASRSRSADRDLTAAPERILDKQPEVETDDLALEYMLRQRGLGR